jgi:uncharacterized membrane-anchored protein YitT (DUF2179 family)
MITTLSAEKIHHDIADMLSRGTTYIEALVEYSKRNDIEIETIAEIVRKSPVIKEKVRTEAVKMKLVRRDQNEAQLCD